MERRWRVDYLTFSYPSNAGESQERLSAKWNDRTKKIAEVNEGELPPVHGGMRYGGNGNWYFVVHLAGAYASQYLEYLDAEDWKHITRLDIRNELCTTLEKHDLDALFRLIHERNTANRNINRRSARPRKKDDKRDGGGDLVSVGSLKSDKYFAVYNKPRENAAVELKLQGTPLKVFVQDMLRYLPHALSKGSTQREWVEDYALVKLNDHARLLMGTTPGEFALERVERRIAVQEELKEGRLQFAKVDVQNMTRNEQLSLLEYLRELTEA